MTDQHPLYTLGQLAQLLWPAQSMPNATLALALSKPATALGAMLKTPAAKKADAEQLAHIVGKMPAGLPDPAGGVSLDDQGQFWLGYYHYMGAAHNAAKLNADHLAIAGKALYGEQWQTELSRSLQLSDARRVRQWLAGERRIPAGVWADIAVLLRESSDKTAGVLNALTHAARD